MISILRTIIRTWWSSYINKFVIYNSWIKNKNNQIVSIESLHCALSVRNSCLLASSARFVWYYELCPAISRHQIRTNPSRFKNEHLQMINAVNIGCGRCSDEPVDEHRKFLLQFLNVFHIRSSMRGPSWTVIFGFFHDSESFFCPTVSFLCTRINHEESPEVCDTLRWQSSLSVYIS